MADLRCPHGPSCETPSQRLQLVLFMLPFPFFRPAEQRARRFGRMEGAAAGRFGPLVSTEKDPNNSKRERKENIVEIKTD